MKTKNDLDGCRKKRYKKYNIMIWDDRWWEEMGKVSLCGHPMVLMHSLCTWL